MAASSSSVELAPGQHHDLVLEIRARPGGDPVAAQAAWEATEAAWEATVPELGSSLAPRESRHSYAVLAGLTSSGGGMVAAATMSLPERAKAGRNYDYRYVWIRDQSLDAGRPWPPTGDTAARRRRGRLRGVPHPRRRPRAQARIHDQRRPCPGRAHAVPAGRIPGGSDKAGNWREPAVRAGIPRARRCCCSRPRPAMTISTPRTGGRPRPRSRSSRPQSDPDAGVWELGTQRWTDSRLMCVAGLRDRRRRGSRASGQRLGSPGRRHPRRHGPRLPARQRALAARSQ